MSTDEAGPFAFRVATTCPVTRARTGSLRTPHGSVDTPVFMPVGTSASVKGVMPADLAVTGSRVVLCNTYHLALRPGEDVIRDLGGLHRFMGWEAPILTDSGGYQVFSLAALTRVDGDGVTFRNHLDGRYLTLTPERATEIQLALGSDILMAFDECLPADADRDRAARSLHERTLPWAERCLALHPRDGRALFGIGQGGHFPDLREEGARALAAMDFDGYAVGGLSVGESTSDMRRMLDVSTAALPESRPRYLMGVGSIPEILDAVALGVDMFDCVLPTRNARNSRALTAGGPLRLKNACHTRDPAPLEPDCPCPACRGGYSRAYLRHLLMAREMLGPILVTLHNLTFMQRLMAGIRTSLTEGHFDSWRQTTLATWISGVGAEPVR